MTCLPERFMAKVQPAENGCWLWTAATNADGYGLFAVHRASKLAHRVAYEATKGPIPDGALLRHRCDTPACVNPAHLEPGTDLDNMADSIARGRRASFRGTRNPRAKLTPAQVASIRALYGAGGVRLVDLAAAFGIGKSQVSNIVRGREWNEVPCATT